MLTVIFAAATATQPDGAELFARQWVEADPRSAMGDGLGPTYNASSCMACHNQGGAGGAGPAAMNVQLADVGVLHRHGGPRFEGLLSTRSMRFGVTERNTPALFGMGALDAIPVGDLLVAEATPDPGFPEVTGRLARDEHGVIGRFGWKGQVPDLPTFVEQACSNELGLQTETVDQPGSSPSLPDMDDGMLFALAGFVADLPAPVELDTPGAAHGAALFEQIGCASCHRATLGGVEGAYTDLMLHDMGHRLSDAASGYGKSLSTAKANTDAATADEWRTPPLWGLRDSAPYLHDGRAATVFTAIDQHGGEATFITRRWRELPEADRVAIETFLLSLAAPGTPGARVEPEPPDTSECPMA